MQEHGLSAAFPTISFSLTAPISSASFALSLLLVFRTNSSYARWDEARKLWGGITNRSRDIVRQVGCVKHHCDVHNKRDTSEKSFTCFAVNDLCLLLLQWLHSEECTPQIRPDMPYTTCCSCLSSTLLTFTLSTACLQVCLVPFRLHHTKWVLINL